ncbi:MAG: hybrid sensor histidine kinase/response regulator [Thiomargarita sp.]|nr:hybrid sensor histidine kinase/response regulator [Thiomargarita sp.]
MILIVDDNSQNLKVLGNILKKNGFLEVAFAESGEKALKFLETQEPLPSLILLDIMMPGISGFEVCKSLKSNAKTKEIPIIFLTAKTEKEDIITGLELGAVDYVTKPFNQKELITRIHTHLQLKETTEKLQQTLVAKDKFFSILGHDLVNVFNSSLGAIRILNSEHPPTDKVKTEFMSLIEDSLEKGHSLLKNLLEWSRSQTGRIKQQPANISLKMLMDSNTRLLANHAAAKNITIFHSVEKNTFIFADENMINTVIRNLISNAIKFTNYEGKITIATQIVATNLVEISFVDTGIGIKTEDIDKLFRIDISYNRVGTAQEQGTGLGLILCKEFIEKNGGTIKVESELDKGSCFYVRLPLGTEEIYNNC